MKVAAGTPKQVPPAADGRWPKKPTGYELGDYEAYILVARRYAMKVCYYHPEWDAGDLEGTILEALLVWPPKDAENVEKHVHARCKFTTTDWTRARLGRQGQKALVFSTLSLEEDLPNPSPLTGDSPTCLADLIPDHVDLEIEAITNVMEAWIPRVLPNKRDQIILQLLVEGCKLHEIGKTLGVTESRISQLVNGRIKPVVRRMFDIDGLRIAGTA